MTNREKYTTEQELVNAIDAWCKSQPQGCISCKYGSLNNNSKTSCLILWLCDEAEEPAQREQNILNKFDNKE